MTNNKPQRVAFFLPALHSGGAEKTFLMLAQYFETLGIKADILVVKKEGSYLTQISPDASIIELGGRGMVQSIFPLMRYLKKEKPDWLISGLPGPNVIALMAKAFVRKYTRYMITQHHPFTENAAAAKKFRTKVRTALCKFLFPTANCVVAVSEGVKQDLLRTTGIKPDKITTIYNPLDLDHIQALSVAGQEHPWLEEGNKTPTLISVGRLCPPKDYETLLTALADIEKVRLLICGEGPDRAKIIGLVDALDLTHRVQLLGFVDNIYSAVSAADLLILSSRHEGFGNALIEAMAVGTQVVSTDCPYGPAEITENGAYGYLVPVGDAQAMKEAIEKTLEAPLKTAEELKQRATHFGIQGAAQAYMRAMGF